MGLIFQKAILYARQQYTIIGTLLLHKYFFIKTGVIHRFGESRS